MARGGGECNNGSRRAGLLSGTSVEESRSDRPFQEAPATGILSATAR